MMTSRRLSFSRASRVALSFLLVGLLIGLYQYNFLRRGAVDWEQTYYPAAHILMQGGNPYVVGTLFNPVWALLPVLPFAMLGERLGMLAWYAFGTLLAGMTAFHFGANWRTLALFLVSPLLLYALLIGNLDSLVLFGLVLPAPVALFLLLIKPQLGMVPAAYIAFRTYKEGGVRKLLATFAPVTAALLLTFVIYGNWTRAAQFNPTYQWWNASLFPYSVPIGILLAYVAFRNRSIKVAAASTPLLSPYLSMGSWIFLFAPAFRNELLMLFLVALSWALYILARVLPG